nr:hypothetical protein [Blastococcus sp. KM273129]
MTRPSGARWSSSGWRSATQVRSVASSTAPSRFELFSSGEKTRKVDPFRRITSRRNVPSTRVASTAPVPGSGTSTA